MRTVGKAVQASETFGYVRIMNCIDIMHDSTTKHRRQERVGMRFIDSSLHDEVSFECNGPDGSHKVFLLCCGVFFHRNVMDMHSCNCAVLKGWPQVSSIYVDKMATADK